MDTIEKTLEEKVEEAMGKDEIVMHTEIVIAVAQEIYAKLPSDQFQSAFVAVMGALGYLE